MEKTEMWKTGMEKTEGKMRIFSREMNKDQIKILNLKKCII